jgi:iron complex transport system ATP-binding protein
MKIKIRNLKFSYPNFSLEIPDLILEEGQVTTIVGPNGAGKTTLLKCLSGLLTIPSGSVLINGQDLNAIKGSRRAQLIGYVPQEMTSIFNYTVLDFVLMGRAAYLHLFSLPSEADKQLALEALAYIGLRDYAQRHLFELSSGERRLVLIARALAQQAQILYLDEPTTFLDPKNEIEILELIKKLSQEMKKTIVLTLHNLEMAAAYSNSLVFIKKGQVRAWGKPDEIMTEDLLEEIYGVKIKIIDWNGHKFLIKGK